MRSFRIIRHGETDWNKQFIYQGHNDIPLNANGRLQAEARAKSINLNDTKQIFTSPLKRALQTAKIINEINGNHLELINVPELMECSSEECARYILNLKKVKKLPDFTKLKGKIESPHDFKKRVKKGLDFVLQKSKDPSPLIIAHGGVITVLCQIFEIDMVSAPNCVIVEFKFEDNKYKTES